MSDFDAARLMEAIRMIREREAELRISSTYIAEMEKQVAVFRDEVRVAKLVVRNTQNLIDARDVRITVLQDVAAKRDKYIAELEGQLKKCVWHFDDDCRRPSMVPKDNACGLCEYNVSVGPDDGEHP